MNSFTPTAQSEAQSAQSLFLSGGFELSEALFELAAQPLPEGIACRNQTQSIGIEIPAINPSWSRSVYPGWFPPATRAMPSGRGRRWGKTFAWAAACRMV
jgi:hypothetical protein